ncbi:Hypothetical predicted protein [Scomber scombrus]|uniref:Uncharacterized protein n=1 Tax=Scomber scombrus TaxID=13677 RepID=A0AAV1Q1A5_SCOSC
MHSLRVKKGGGEKKQQIDQRQHSSHQKKKVEKKKKHSDSREAEAAAVLTEAESAEQSQDIAPNKKKVQELTWLLSAGRKKTGCSPQIYLLEITGFESFRAADAKRKKQRNLGKLKPRLMGTMGSVMEKNDPQFNF